MKREKLSLEKMRNVLSHVLSREEMKEVMAGSGDPGHQCPTFCPSGVPPGSDTGCSINWAINKCVCNYNLFWLCE